MGKSVQRPNSPLSTNPNPFKRLVVVVDMQTLPPSATSFHGPVSRGINRINHLLRVAQEMKIPSVFVEPLPIVIPQHPQIWDSTAQFFRRTSFNLLDNSDFAAFLQSNQLREIVLCGYSRRFAIAATARDAIKRGYKVITSDQILFGDGLLEELAAFRDLLSLRRLFVDNGHYFRSTSKLMASLYP